MARSIRRSSVKRKTRLGNPKKDFHLSTKAKPVKISYMEGFEPEGKIK